jgi:hypothetical protein
MANICRGLRKKNFFISSPQVTHIGFIDVKKMGRKSHTWAPLRWSLLVPPLTDLLSRIERSVPQQNAPFRTFIRVRIRGSGSVPKCHTSGTLYRIKGQQIYEVHLLDSGEVGLQEPLLLLQLAHHLILRLHLPT